MQLWVMTLWTIGNTCKIQWKHNGNPIDFLSAQSNEHKSESGKTMKPNMTKNKQENKHEMKRGGTKGKVNNVKWKRTQKSNTK